MQQKHPFSHWQGSAQLFSQYTSQCSKNMVHFVFTDKIVQIWQLYTQCTSWWSKKVVHFLTDKVVHILKSSTHSTPFNTAKTWSIFSWIWLHTFWQLFAQYTSLCSKNMVHFFTDKVAHILAVFCTVQLQMQLKHCPFFHWQGSTHSDTLCTYYTSKYSKNRSIFSLTR